METVGLKAVHDSRLGAKCAMIGSQASALHLDDLLPDRQHDEEWSCVDINSGTFSISASRQFVSREAKQREHVRLFQEYLKSCKNAKCDSSIDSSDADLVSNSCQRDTLYEPTTPSKELSSFLPHNRHGCRSRKASSVTVCSIPENSGLFVSGGRDAPASTAAPRAAAFSERLGARKLLDPPSIIAAPPFDEPKSCSGPLTAAAVREKSGRREEVEVYRAQVATALAAGHAVWL